MGRLFCDYGLCYSGRIGLRFCTLHAINPIERAFSDLCWFAWALLFIYVHVSQLLTVTFGDCVVRSGEMR